MFERIGDWIGNWLDEWVRVRIVMRIHFIILLLHSWLILMRAIIIETATTKLSN